MAVWTSWGVKVHKPQFSRMNSSIHFSSIQCHAFKIIIISTKIITIIIPAFIRATFWIICKSLFSVFVILFPQIFIFEYFICSIYFWKSLCTLGLFIWLVGWLVIYLFSVYLLLRETETECKWVRRRESGRHRVQSRPLAPSHQHRARCGALTHDLWDHDPSKRKLDAQMTEPPRRPRDVLL